MSFSIKTYTSKQPNFFIFSTSLTYNILNTESFTVSKFFLAQPIFFKPKNFSFYHANLAEFKHWSAFFRFLLTPYPFLYSYLHLKGIGFRLYKSVASNSLIVNSGYNHYTRLSFPNGFKIVVRKAYALCYSSMYRHNYYVNVIRSVRFPDPYRAKGFRFRNQTIKLKVGKQR